MKKKPPVAQYFVLGLLFFAACAYQVRATIAAFPVRSPITEHGVKQHRKYGPVQWAFGFHQPSASITSGTTTAREFAAINNAFG